MSRFDKWVIEARSDDGALCFDCEQPPVGAFTEDEIAQMVFRVHPDAIMSGMDMRWTEQINPKWRMRRKTW